MPRKRETKNSWGLLGLHGGSWGSRLNIKKFLHNHHIFFSNIYLVGGFNHLEKYEFVNGKDDIPYINHI